MLSPNSPVFKRELIPKLVYKGSGFNEMNYTIRFKDEYFIDIYSPLSFHKEIMPFSYYLKAKKDEH